MNSFKLLHLPWLAFQEIIKTMDFIPLFNLSLVSNRMFLNIKLAKRKILPIKLLLAENNYMIKISDEKEIEWKKTVFKLNIYMKEYVCVEEKEKYKLKSVKFGGLKIEIANHTSALSYPGFIGVSNNKFFNFFRRLHDLFVCPGTCLMIEKVLLHEKFLANLVGLNILSVGTSRDESLIWSEQELSILLDYTKPTFELLLRSPLTSDFNDKSVLNFHRIRICHAKWLKIEDLMTANGSIIVLDYHNFKENDLKQYIQHWLAGNNQTLTRFQCRRFRNRPNCNNILEGVEYSKWDEMRRSRYHIFNSLDCKSILDCKEGLDFERSDGKLASVFQNADWFCFAVWHHRFH
ncbi:unnamed protein product [Caenorhabditis brenneri]